MALTVNGQAGKVSRGLSLSPAARTAQPETRTLKPGWVYSESLLNVISLLAQANNIRDQLPTRRLFPIVTLTF